MIYTEALREAKRKILQGYLDGAGGCVRLAARDAGVHRSALYKLMRSVGLAPPNAARYEERHRGNAAWESLAG